MKKLNAIALASLPRGEHPDHVVGGLLFWVGGRDRTWQLRYRTGGKRKRIVLGHYPAMGQLKARDAARKALERIEGGAPATETTPAHPRRDALTVGTIIDRYEKMKQREAAPNKTLASALWAVRLGLDGYLTMAARDFSKADLRVCRDRINERGALMMANRFISYLGPIWRWAAQEDLVPHNFVSDLRKSPERKRDKVLSRAELGAIWGASFEVGTGRAAKNFGRLVRFLLITAQRRSEGALLRYGDLIDGNLWRQVVNKSSREHRLRLPPLAMHEVGTSDNPKRYVFEGDPGKSISGFSKFKAALDANSGVSDWRLHDLRRTAASLMQELDVSPSAISAVLNHAVPGIAAVYLRGELDRQKTDALAKWADEIKKITASSKYKSSV